MRILIVTEYFPPENTIGSLRLYSFAKFWNKAGHDITVLTALKDKNENDLTFDISKYKVIRETIPFTLKSTRKTHQEITSAHKVKGNIKKLLKVFLKLAKVCYSYFRNKTHCFSARFPHFGDVWAKKCIPLVNPFDFDLVLSSGGPYSVHRVGLALKKANPKIKWVVDWRDLWTKGPVSKGFWLFRPYERMLENRFHQNADLITTVSDLSTQILQAMTTTPVKTIFNGFDSDDFTSITNRQGQAAADKYTIVYTGSLYRDFQDVTPLFKAVSNIKNKNTQLYKKIRLQFAGVNADVSDIAEEYGITDVYEYMGFIKRDEALKLQHDASAVLFMDFGEVDGIMTGKLFEYIILSKKIIAIGKNANSAPINLIKASNTGIYLGTDVDLIEQHLILSLTNGEANTYAKNYMVINEYTRENQANKLLRYILQG